MRAVGRRSASDAVPGVRRGSRSTPKRVMFEGYGVTSLDSRLDPDARRPLPEPGFGHAGQALSLVDPFVVADLAEDISERLVGSVVVRERRGESTVLPLGVLGDEQGILVFGVVLEIGVEPVAPCRTEDIEKPRELVVGEGQELRDDVRNRIRPSRVTFPIDEFLEDEQVTLLVVLLGRVSVTRSWMRRARPVRPWTWVMAM